MSLAGRLQRFLDEHGVDYRESRRALVTKCLNASCGKEDHCYIWRKDGGAICFRCGRKWGWRWVVAAIARCSPDESYSKLFGGGAAEHLDKKVVFTLYETPPEVETPEQEPIALGPDFVTATSSLRAIGYLAHRGSSNPDAVYDYDLRYHALMDAVVFPIKRQGKTYGWQARKIEPKKDELRLISRRSFSKSKFLLNHDRAQSFKKVVLVEGPFDCLKVDLKRHGVTGIASLGKGVSQDQIKMILDMPCTDFYVGLDPDAVSEVYEVVGRIGLGKKMFRIRPPKHRKDFGECSEEETLEALGNALPVSGPADFLEVYLKE